MIVPRGIGTLREKPLHASLKGWYAEAGDRVEATVDGYVVDLVRGDLLIEIQTRGFAGIRAKIDVMLAGDHRVRIVHPIAVDRWLVRVGPDGELLGRRQSPRHGGAADVAAELVSLPDLLGHPGFQIEIVLTREEEYRRHDPRRCWRRHGWTVVERRLVEVVDRVVLAGPADLARLLPPDLPESFTTADLARLLGRPRRLAQQLVYCLRHNGLVEVVGRRGRATEFRSSGNGLVGDDATGR